MKTYTPEEIKDIIEKHQHWLKEDFDGWENMRADLSGADLSGAVLSDAENLDSVKYSVHTAFFAIGCPEKGAFTAFKKCGNHIVELEVCADAKRSSATSRKCRVSKAKVVEITNLDGTPADVTEVASNYNSNFKYHVGEIVEEPRFEENRWIECTYGIHCFITRQEAVIYDA